MPDGCSAYRRNRRQTQPTAANPATNMGDNLAEKSHAEKSSIAKIEITVRINAAIFGKKNQQTACRL
jgi:hypothetical protein